MKVFFRDSSGMVLVNKDKYEGFATSDFRFALKFLEAKYKNEWIILNHKGCVYFETDSNRDLYVKHFGDSIDWRGSTVVDDKITIKDYQEMMRLV